MQAERLKYQKEYMESIKKLEEQLVMNQPKHGNGKVTTTADDASSQLNPSTSVFLFSEKLLAVSLSFPLWGFPFLIGCGEHKRGNGAYLNSVA